MSTVRAIVPASLVCCLALIAKTVSAFAADQEQTDTGTVARQTVARALGIAPADARVISIEPRIFRDASLDCRQPDTAYAQVITPGFRVLVEANARRFDVRVAGTGGSICYQRKRSTERPADQGTKPRQPGAAARQDLALRLDVPLDAVTVTGLRQLKPGDHLPGCGEACAADSPPDACGVAVQLRTGDQNFDYLALPAAVRPCPDIASR